MLILDLFDDFDDDFVASQCRRFSPTADANADGFAFLFSIIYPSDDAMQSMDHIICPENLSSESKVL